MYGDNRNWCMEVYRASHIDNSTSAGSIVNHLLSDLWVCFSNHFEDNVLSRAGLAIFRVVFSSIEVLWE